MKTDIKGSLYMICLYLHIIFEPEPEGRILTHDQGAVVNYSSPLSLHKVVGEGL